MTIDASIAAVKAALEADSRVSAAILFGSAAKGVARASSDLDVAIIAASTEDFRALEAGYLELTGRLSAVVGRDVHLTLLEGVEPVLGRQAFLYGRTLFDRNPGRTADVLERITLQYFDGEYHRRMRAAELQRRRGARHG